nr:PREDICTED: polycystin-1-like isoform X2 [Lepisosteus oculatus]
MKLLVCTLFLAAAVIPMKSQADGKREFPDSGDVESTEDEKLSPPELPWETRSGKAWGNLRNHGEHSGSSEDRALSLKGNFLVGRTSLTQRRWHSKHQGSRLIRSILGDAKCAYKNGAPERSKINAPSLEMDSHDHSQDRQPPPTGITLWPSEILPALPCPQHCVCNHTAVNCSGAGLTEVPRAGSCPLHTEILDLSRNRITHLRPDAFADFKDLKKIKFGFNSYKYDCSLAWLKDWLAQGSLTVLDSEDVRCSQPSSAFDVLVNMLDSAVSPCADSFVSCVPNPHSLSDAVLLYLRCEPQVRDKKSCEALCRHRGYSHYALDPARHCLCGTLAPPASVQAQACSGVCSNIVQTVVCGRTIIHTAFPVLVSLEIVTAPWHSLYQPVELSVSAALPVFQWEFGDGSRPYNTTNTRVLYKYALPGTYKVDVHAMMGGYQLSLSVFVKVVMPLGQVQLEYPLQAETLNTLNFLVHIDKGTDLSAMWSVKDTRGKETTVHSICPRGSRIHLTNMHCYWLVQTQESWQDARRTCQQTTGGDLAVVSSADIQSFLQQTFPLTDNVWIGLRDGTSVKPVWVDGAPADVFHNWGNANKNQKGCVQMMMSLMGLWKSTDCGTKIPFICEKHTSALLPGPDTFLAGVPVMTGVYKVNNLSVLPAPPGLGQSNVEVMLFPGLWFSHAGRVVSVEFVIQPIKNQTRARVQVLRPYCSPSQHLVPPGCSVLLNPFACCSTEPLCNTTGGCARGQQWCHLQDSCQPLSSPCSSYTPQGQSFGRPPRHTATPPFYHLVADLPLSLPHSSEQVHVNVLLLKREINIFPDDILAVQHDAGAGSFLQCPRSDDSPWRQSYLSLRRTGWLEGGVSAQPSQSVWVDEVVCDLRVLYSDSLQGYAVTSPLGTGHRDPGSYTYSIAVSNPVSSTTACCTVDVRTPVWGLQIIHPLPVGGMIHIPVNKPTLIVIKILSGVNATSSWSAPVLRSGIAFSSSCPSALLAYVPGCTRTTPDTWFSYAYATVALPVSQILNISVSNGVSAQNLSVVLQSHQEVQGLRMKPQGDRRMLVDVSQEFRASVRSGSSVTYTWVIDDLILFAYHGQTYSVVFRKPAVYNLKVTAENPVSSESLDVKLTADLMKPLEDPVFLSVAEVMAVNTSQVFVFRVKVDVSIGVTFRWDFGDDIPAVSHSFSPPYDADQRKQIYLQDSASHIYTQPGNYSVRVEVFNSYDRTEKAVLVMVQSPLSGLSLFLTPAYPAVNQDFELRALPRPSTYGVCYLWNFADGSKEIKECNSKVSHTFKTAGVYNVTVTANTMFNMWRSWMAVEVVERIAGLKLSYNGPNELGTPTVLKGTVSSGTRLFWTFDMGDGHVFSNVSDASISYIYKSAGNYSARINVDNPVSHAFQSISVEVYRLIIGGILPSGCFVARREVPFQALVSGKESAVTFHWIFGDGSPLAIVQGNSTAVHRYASPGIYYVNITAFSPVRSASYQTEVCMEDLITSLAINSSHSAAAVGQEICFNASVIPKPDEQQSYQFLWYTNFFNRSPTRGSSNYCCIFKEEGSHHVKVVVSNNVSNRTATVLVIVLMPVRELIMKQDRGPPGAVAVNKSYAFMAEASSGTNVTFQWDFSDGSYIRHGQTVSHVYTSPGRFNVSVTALNAVSRERVTSEFNVLIPISDLVLITDRPVVEVGQEMVITATVNVMVNVSFYWLFHPSFTPELGTSTFKHIFLKAGVYNISVVAQNPISKQQATIRMEAYERICGLSIKSQDLISERYIPTGTNVRYSASVAQGSNVTFEWLIYQNASNRPLSEGENVTLHTDTPGDFVVILKARNPLGLVNSSLLLRAVERIAGVKVLTEGDIVPLGKPIKIMVSVDTGTDLQYIWRVDSNHSPLLSNESFLFHAYRLIGTVVIKVSVTNMLGSSEGSKQLSVQEEVSEVGFLIQGTLGPFYVPSDSPVALEGYVKKGNDLRWEWKFSRRTGSTLLYNQSVIHSFQEAGKYLVSLNVSNNISWKDIAHEVIVQDTIQGLTVNASHSTLCEGDQLVFKVTILKGSDVHFSLNFPTLNYLVNLETDTYMTSDLPVGNHSVTVRARNHVSSSATVLMVEIVEKIHGLRLVNCCFHILEAKKEVSFQAELQSGFQVHYQWTFQLSGYPLLQAAGAKVFYTPPANGSLTATIVASNAFCSLSLTENVSVQSPVLHGEMFSNLTDVFIHQPLEFWVLVKEGSDLLYRWNFGDSRKTVVNRNSTAIHRYHTPGRYLAEVTIFNNVSNFTTQLFINIRKLECNVPKVDLIQGKPRILKSRPSYFEASVDLQRCTAYKAGYLWEAFWGPDCLEKDRKPLQNIDVTSLLLVLPKLTLEVGSYCLRFTAALQGTPLLQSKSVNITVLQSQLVALIKGGSHRVWAAQEDLLLDGSGSHDPDIVGGEDRDLQYFWSYAVQNTTVSSLRPSILNNSSTFILSRFNLQPNALYVFTLTVFKAGKLPASTTQSVMVRLGRVLPVNIQCRSCSALSSYRVSHSVHVVLSGQCKGCSNETLYEWTAEGSHGEVLELNNVSTTTGNSFPDLVIRKGVLQNGVHYNFTLSAAHPSKEFWGSASIILVPNYPPSGGICTLTPNSTIYLLETVVTYHCSGWMDEDGDLTQLIYTMHVEVCQHRYHQCHLLTLYRGTKSTFSTLVPVGSTESSSFSHISVLIEVEDALGGKVIALNSTLTVLLPVFPVESQGMMEWLTNKSQSKLWDMTQQSNPQEVIPYSIALTSMLNQIQNVNEWDRQDLIRIRSNITQVLTSLSMSTMHDVAQISSALAQCVAVPHEFVCGECKIKTLEATRKMIAMIEDKTVLGDDTPVSTGTNVLQILGGLMAAAGHSTDSSKIPEITASAFSLVGDLMRSLMRSRVPREEVLKLTAPEIRVMGHRSETADLMCTSPSSPCQFYIPKGLSNQLKEKREVVQILMKMDANLFSANPPISTELAAMEFSTPEGLPIPISNLSKENAIHVMLETQKGVDGTTALIINPQGSVNFTVKAIETNPKAGLFISFNFTLHPGLRPESSPMVRIFIDDHPAPSENQHLLRRDILLTSTSETSHVEETIFLSPLHNGTVWEYHVNISSLLVGQEVQASVCVFSSLCQYFSLEERRWSSQGLSPLNGSSLKTAHCLTKHLTVFGASLFVHHSALILLPPSEGPAQNHVVGIVCVILLVIYLATVLIAHKMDDIDITRVGTIPLCGQSGRYQYQVLVKTGWTRGSGTTAHVGISLYGLNKSGSRHLDREEAFQRNSLDVFQIETDANLGEVWKIRIWHDNTGLDPSWYLQYVIVWDKQTSNMFFFLVEDWLSVENETNEGMVEKEVLATCPQELLRFYRIFRTQLIRGIFDRHLWVSVWERLPRSRFTRTQRVTCCALTLFLYLGAGAVWYGAVGQRNSSGPVSAHMLVNAEIVAVGMTVAALVFPIQLLFIVLFRMTRSKVIVEDPESCVAAPQTVEMDVCLEHSELGSSSFLSLPGGLDSILDGVSESSESLESRRSESSLGIPAKQEHESSVNPWASCDSIFDIPDLLASEPSLNRARILKRKKALLQLSIESPASSADDPLVLSWSKPEVTQGLEQNQLTVSEEDLIKSIAADNVVQSTSSSRVTSDSGRYSPCADTELSDPLESSCSGWSEFSDERKPYSGQLHKTSSSISGLTSASSFIPSPSPASVCSMFSTRLGVPRRAPRRLFPPQVLSVTYLLALLVLGSSLAVAVLYGTTFHNSVVLMWLISTFSAFLTSAVLLEPAKVIVQSLFLALVMKPVDPDEDDTLVEEPVVKKVSERISKVRPPCGYGLLQAKEEARKVRALRTLMKSCIAHMMFLLVVLVVNYQDRLQGDHGRLLHSAVKRSLVAGSGEGMNVSMIRGAAEAWCWMQRNLVPHLYQNPSLQLLGVARLRRLQSGKGCWNHGIAGLTSRDISLHPTVHAWPNTHTWDLNFHQNISSNHRQPFPSNSFMWLWYLGQFGVYSSEEEVVDLGNSTESTRQLLAELSQASWINTMTRGVFVQFTQYHRDTGLFVVVTVLMEWHQPGSAITSLSILPVCMPSSSLVPDLQAVMMVVLLLLALSILGSELHTLSRERCLYFRQGWHYLQLLVVLLALGVAALHFAFLSLSASLLRHHCHNRHSFTNFHTAVALSEASSSLSAILLTILILKNVRQLRFVRRWAVFGKTIQLVWKELCGASLVLLLLFLILAQTGYLLFSDTVEEFRTFGWTCFSLASGLWGKTRLGIVAHRHPISGLLYLLTVLGGLMWVLRWLFGTMLIQSYRAIQTEMYRPSMGPQDYEMVEFFIKRFKLWIGISKTKEFRHKVKFEGMESLPSRSSHDSKMSEPVSCGLDPTRLGSALSLGSEDSSVSESSHSEDYDVCFYMDRLLPTVNNLLAQFDRVNKVIEDLYQIEVDLQKAQSQISEKRKQRKKSLIKQPTTAPPHLLPSLPPLSTVSGTLRLPRTHTTFSESALSRLRPHCSQVSDPGLFDNCVPVRRPSLMDTGVTRVPGRRAWNSGPSLSADITQRPYPPAGSTVRDRPKSEEGKRGQRSDQAPVKRRAWHHDGT